MVGGISERVSKTDSVQDLLVDKTLEAAGTWGLVKLYQSRTQPLLDQGVRSSDWAAFGTPSDHGLFWPLTGSTERAELLLKEIDQKIVWEAETATQRYTDYARAAGVAEYVQQTSDLLSMATGPNVFVGAVQLGSRVGNLGLLAVQSWQNADNLICIDYLSQRAAEMAYDALQPGEDCRYLFAGAANAAHLGQAAALPAPSPLHSRLHLETSAYAAAVGQLQQAAQAGDQAATEQAYAQFDSAERALNSTLGQVEALLATRPLQTGAEQTLLAESLAYDNLNLAIILSLAQALSGGETATLQDSAQSAQTLAGSLMQDASQVDLTPPADQAVLLIDSLTLTMPAADQASLHIELRNVGGAAGAAAVSVEAGGQALAPRGAEIEVAPGGLASLELQAPLSGLPAGATLAVKLWSGGRLHDQRSLGLELSQAAEQPTQPAAPPTQPPAAAAPTPTPSPAKPGGLCGSAAGLLLAPLLGWLWRKRTGPAQ
jgi:hypothetical protein